MRILAIETSMGRTSVALSTGQPDKPCAVRRLEGVGPQAEALIPLIRDLISGEDIQFSALNRIAAGALAGALAGLSGLALLEIFCPNLNRYHILVWHLGAALTSTIVGILAGIVAQRLDIQRLDIKR